MPLLVNCPTGCQFRVPANRAGRVVRCPQCKSAVRIAAFDQPLVDNGQVIEVSAKLAKKKKEATHKQSGETEFTQETSIAMNAKPNALGGDRTLPVASADAESKVPQAVSPTQVDQEELKQLDPAIQRVLQSPPRVPLVMHSRPWRRVEPLTEVSSTGDIPSLELDIPVKSEKDSEQPTSVAQAEVASDEPEKRPLSIPGIAAFVSHQDDEPVAEATNAGVVPLATGKSRADAGSLGESSLSSPQLQDAISKSESISASELAAIPGKPVVTKPPVINLEMAAPEAESEVDKKSWEQRLLDANADRRMLSRFLAGCLLLIAIVNIVPAVSHWYGWSAIAENTPLPRWIYLQIFVGAIYTVYSVFLLQIGDWSALRSVSVAMLVVAFTFGVISTGLLVGETFAGVLGIPYSLNRRAAIWCVAMLILATLMSYWAGKESSNWRRAEMLLHEIIQKTG